MPMKTCRRGFTLTEVMVATAILLMVVGAALSVFVSINRSMAGLSDAISLNAGTRLTQERILLDLRSITKVTQADNQVLAGEFVEPGSGSTGTLTYQFENGALVRRITLTGKSTATSVTMANLRTTGSVLSRFAYRNRSGVSTATAAEVRAIRIEFVPLPTFRQTAGLTTGQNAAFWSALVQLRNITN